MVDSLMAWLATTVRGQPILFSFGFVLFSLCTKDLIFSTVLAWVLGFSEDKNARG